MPNFHVLQCFSCHTYQVHQETRSKKWKCKVCGENQSIIKVFGKGSGKDCRQHVQKLNMLRYEKDEMQHTVLSQQNDHLCQETARPCREEVSQQASKWDKYLEPGTKEDLAGVGDDCATDIDEQWVTDQQACSRVTCKHRMGEQICNQQKKPKLDRHVSLSVETVSESDVKAQSFLRPHHSRRNHEMDPAKRDVDLSTDVHVCGRRSISDGKVSSHKALCYDVHDGHASGSCSKKDEQQTGHHRSRAADGGNIYFGKPCCRTDRLVNHPKPCGEPRKSGSAAGSKWAMYLAAETDEEDETM